MLYNNQGRALLDLQTTAEYANKKHKEMIYNQIFRRISEDKFGLISNLTNKHLPL